MPQTTTCFHYSTSLSLSMLKCETIPFLLVQLILIETGKTHLHLLVLFLLIPVISGTGTVTEFIWWLLGILFLYIHGFYTSALRFLVASFWRLASQVGGLVSKLPSASVKSLSIIGRGRRPSLLQWKGGNHRFTAAPLQLPFAQHDHERRQRIA